MAKNNASKKQMAIVEDDFDFSEMPEMMEPSYNDGIMANMLGNMIEASSNQMLLALELTKLAAEKDSKIMSVDDVLAAFKKAASIIEEKFPLNTLLEKFTASD